MSKRRKSVKKVGVIITVFLVCYFTYRGVKKINFNSKYEVGQKIDSLHNVIVYYNGGVDNVEKRNTKDGYNLGLEYQCVEFVKRYYFEYYSHKMPDSYGHAISFYDNNVLDGKLNKKRNLIQYSNPSITKPKQGDLIVMKGSVFNKYGHVAIVSNVSSTEIEIIQQNPGPFSASRDSFKLLKKESGKWKIKNKKVLGWLRK